MRPAGIDDKAYATLSFSLYSSQCTTSVADRFSSAVPCSTRQTVHTKLNVDDRCSLEDVESWLFHEMEQLWRRDLFCPRPAGGPILFAGSEEVG